MSTPTKAEIDIFVLARIMSGANESMAIGGAIENRFGHTLPMIRKKDLSGFWNACEHANRSCQRLRKAGKIIFAKKCWSIVREQKGQS